MSFLNMWNNNFFNSSNRSPNIPFNASESTLSLDARDTILKIIDQGTNMMKMDTSNEQFNIWVSYAKNMLDIAVKNDQLRIKTRFVDIVVSAYNTNLQPYQKIHFCVQFLLGVLKSV